MTLAELIEAHHANAFHYMDAGNGAAWGEAGTLLPYDDEAAAAYGATPLAKAEPPGPTGWTWVSEWIEADAGDGFRPTNPYRYRIAF